MDYFFLKNVSTAHIFHNSKENTFFCLSEAFTVPHLLLRKKPFSQGEENGHSNVLTTHRGLKSVALLLGLSQWMQLALYIHLL